MQDDLQCKYTGGTVLHLYMNERISLTNACRIFVKKVMENFKLPYVTVTPLFSVCQKHGYLMGNIVLSALRRRDNPKPSKGDNMKREEILEQTAPNVLNVSCILG